MKMYSVSRSRYEIKEVEVAKKTDTYVWLILPHGSIRKEKRYGEFRSYYEDYRTAIYRNRQYLADLVQKQQMQLTETYRNLIASEGEIEMYEYKLTKNKSKG